MSDKKETPVLDNFSRDLTLLAEQGKLDPVIGRSDEIDRLTQILSRRKKNNPILLGEPGVGKCVTGSTMITVRNKESGEEINISVSDFKNLLENS